MQGRMLGSWDSQEFPTTIDIPGLATHGSATPKSLKIAVKWLFGPNIFFACGALQGGFALAKKVQKVPKNVIKSKVRF